MRRVVWVIVAAVLAATIAVLSTVSARPAQVCVSSATYSASTGEQQTSISCS